MQDRRSAPFARAVRRRFDLWRRSSCSRRMRSVRTTSAALRRGGRTAACPSAVVGWPRSSVSAVAATESPPCSARISAGLPRRRRSPSRPGLCRVLLDWRLRECDAAGHPKPSTPVQAGPSVAQNRRSAQPTSYSDRPGRCAQWHRPPRAPGQTLHVPNRHRHGDEQRILSVRAASGRDSPPPGVEGRTHASGSSGAGTCEDEHTTFGSIAPTTLCSSTPTTTGPGIGYRTPAGVATAWGSRLPQWGARQELRAPPQGCHSSIAA